MRLLLTISWPRRVSCREIYSHNFIIQLIRATILTLHNVLNQSSFSFRNRPSPATTYPNHSLRLPNSCGGWYSSWRHPVCSWATSRGRPSGHIPLQLCSTSSIVYLRSYGRTSPQVWRVSKNHRWRDKGNNIHVIHK